MAQSSIRSVASEAIAVEASVNQDKGTPTPLSAEEVVNHPAYNTTRWKLDPTSSGRCKVAEGRSGGPFEIHWEIHGTGPTKIVWIMGHGAMRTSWKRQTKHFGHTNSTQYSCLILDNRGIGLSDKPTTRYSTYEMALDMIDLLKHVKWLDPSSPRRHLNIYGISMGGMISQELALLIPEHIQSLGLISTAPRLFRTVPFVQNLRQRINMFVPRDIDVQLEETSHRLFSTEFLKRQDLENPDPKLNYPTNRDRFAAGELQKRADKEGFTRKGFILQAIAAGWHHKSAAQLNELATKVGRDRIVVVHGKLDQMLTFPHFEAMKADLGQGGITYQTWDDCGHVPVWEKEDEFNGIVEKLISKTASL